MHMDNSIIRLLLRVPEYFDMYKGYVDEIVSMYSDPEKTVSDLQKLSVLMLRMILVSSLQQNNSRRT